MISKYKLRRELLRLKGHAAEFTLGSVRRMLYDFSRAKRIKVTAGAQPARPEMAVFLIYQPGGGKYPKLCV